MSVGSRATSIAASAVLAANKVPPPTTAPIANPGAFFLSLLIILFSTSKPESPGLASTRVVRRGRVSSGTSTGVVEGLPPS